MAIPMGTDKLREKFEEAIRMLDTFEHILMLDFTYPPEIISQQTLPANHPQLLDHVSIVAGALEAMNIDESHLMETVSNLRAAARNYLRQYVFEVGEPSFESWHQIRDMVDRLGGWEYFWD